MLFHISKGAISEAAKSNYIFKHGAISFNRGKPVGKGFNNTEIHGGLARNYGYFGGRHAEVQALQNVQKADTLLIVRIRRGDKKLSMSRPCDKCLKYLRDKGVKKVWFSNWSGEIEKMRL